MAANTQGTRVKNASPSRVTTRNVQSRGKQNRISTSFRENIFVCESRAPISSPTAPLLKYDERIPRIFRDADRITVTLDVGQRKVLERTPKRNETTSVFVVRYAIKQLVSSRALANGGWIPRQVAPCRMTPLMVGLIPPQETKPPPPV